MHKSTLHACRSQNVHHIIQRVGKGKVYQISISIPHPMTNPKNSFMHAQNNTQILKLLLVVNLKPTQMHLVHCTSHNQCNMEKAWIYVEDYRY